MASLHFIIKNRGHVESRRLDLSKFDARQTNKRTRTISPPPPHLLSGMTPSRLRLRKASVRPSWFAFVEPFFFFLCLLPSSCVCLAVAFSGRKSPFSFRGRGRLHEANNPKMQGFDRRVVCPLHQCIQAGRKILLQVRNTATLPQPLHFSPAHTVGRALAQEEDVSSLFFVLLDQHPSPRAPTGRADLARFATWQ